MFERFTDPARHVVVLARDEARALKHGYIGTEHILLGLLREGGLAARVLQSCNITIERVHGIVGSGEEVAPGQIPLTPAAKNVLERASREALTLGSNSVGSEHILLALVHENEEHAAPFLLDFDAHSQTIRAEIMRMLGWSGGGHRHPPPEPVQRERGGGFPHAVTDDGAFELIEIVTPDIQHHLGRFADAGDLLVALASVPNGLAARMFAALGINPAALQCAAAEARQGSPGRGDADALALKIEKVRRLKEAKIYAMNFQAAADLRDRERQLATEARRLAPELDVDRLEHALTELRTRLGLPAI